MTDANLLLEIKKGLNIAAAVTAFDGVLTQKMLATKAYLKNAGVNDTVLGTDLGTNTIVVGVTDLWNISSGEIKFSPAFNICATQLTAASLLTTP